MHNSRKFMGTDPISSLLIKFSVPAIIGMVINALYNVVDRMFIGNAPDLGANGLAGITIGFPIMILQMSIGQLFGVGGATLFSMRLGRGDKKGATLALNTALVLSASSGIVFMILGHFLLNQILTWFGASPTVLPFSAAYMRVIFFGSVFQTVGMTLNNFLRADGQPKLAMMTMMFGAGTNILLDPIFIYGLNMGMKGAALATILSQMTSMVWTLFYFLNRDNPHHIRLDHFKFQWHEVGQIVSLGTPIFMTQIGNSILNLVLNKTLYHYGGDMAVSGMGIINSVNTLLIMPILGINQGVQPIVSYNFGAKKYRRIIETEKLAMTAATLFISTGWFISRFFPDLIISMFSNDPALIAFTAPRLFRWQLVLPLVGFQILGANFFQAIGQSRKALFLTLSRQIIFLLPAIVLFSRFWGIEGLFYAAPFADTSAIVVTAITFYFGIKHLLDLEKEEEMLV